MELRGLYKTARFTEQLTNQSVSFPVRIRRARWLMR